MRAIRGSLARAAAYRSTYGSTAALRLLEELPGDRVEAYQPYWVVRALSEAELGLDGASGSARTALALTESPAVRAHLEATLGGALS